MGKKLEKIKLVMLDRKRVLSAPGANVIINAVRWKSNLEKTTTLLRCFLLFVQLFSTIDSEVLKGCCFKLASSLP